MPLRSGPRKPIARRTRSASSVEFGAGNFLHVCRSDELHAHAVQLSTFPFAREALRQDAVFAVAAFFVSGRRAEDVRPVRPWIVRGAFRRRFGQQFELHDGRAPWRWAVPRQSAPVSPPPMMTTCLVLRADEFGIGNRIAFAAFVLQRQVLHREMDAIQIAPGHGQIARRCRATGQKNRIEVAVRVPQRRRSRPTFAFVRNLMPSSIMRFSRRFRTCFSILNSGMP